MWQVAKLLLMVLLPLAWGLGSDYLFALVRKDRDAVEEGLAEADE